MLTQIGHVVFAVRDLEACRSFYGDQLGLRQVGRGVDGDGRDGYCFSIGPSVLEMRHDPEAPRGDDDTGARAEVNHMALYVDDCEATYAILKDRGVAFKAPPHSTEIGHRNMQRTLLTLWDPNGFTLQISQTIDPRPHHDARKTAKAGMAARSKEEGDLFGGIDHITTYCTSFANTQSFYTRGLGLEEFFYNTTREEGKVVEAGFEQSAYAIGGTDIELATSAQWAAIGAGPVRVIGFWSDDIDADYEAIRGRAEVDRAPGDWAPLPDLRLRAFMLRGPDGQAVQIAQPADHSHREL